MWDVRRRRAAARQGIRTMERGAGSVQEGYSREESRLIGCPANPPTCQNDRRCLKREVTNRYRGGTPTRAPFEHIPGHRKLKKPPGGGFDTETQFT